IVARVPSYRATMDEVVTPVTGEPIARLILTPNPPAQPAPPDTGLKYSAEPIPDGDKASMVLATPLDDKAPPAVFVAAADTLHRGDKTGIAPLHLPASAKAGGTQVVAFDFDNDFRNDLASAGPGGLRLFHQNSDGSFVDVTAKAKLPAAITN